MENSKSKHHGGDGNLGVNKMGKNIRKSPLHQSNLGNNGGSSAAAAAAVINIASRPSHPMPQVYNISKNDFRDVVQQLTGSPSLHNATPPRPPQNSSKPQSMRLQKIRPPPLTPINRPPLRPPVPAAPAQAPAPAGHAMVPYNNNNALSRPAQFGQPGPNPNPPLQHPGEMTWGNTAESPISAYMRILQNSMMEPGSKGNQVQPQFQPHPPQQPHGNNVHQIQQQNPNQPPPPPPPVQGNVQPPNPASSLLLPNPHVPPMMPSPRFNGPHPPMNTANPPVPSFPSPTSQFLLSSPTGYMSFLSPRSPYPLLSPGVQFPTPLTPNFPFSPFGQPGVLGPGPQTPVSPGLFPLSPSGFFQMASPRWRGP